MAQRSAADRIRDYKQLLDEGMITQEEFELKKQKILEAEEIIEDAEPAAAGKGDESIFSGHYFQDKANSEPKEPKPENNSESNTGGNTGGNTKGRTGGSSISTKATGVLAYLTWIGFLIAFFAGDREGAKFHLNQGLVLNLFGLLSSIPVVGKFWSIFIFICMIMGVINANNGENKELPLIGGIRLL